MLSCQSILRHKQFSKLLLQDSYWCMAPAAFTGSLAIFLDETFFRFQRGSICPLMGSKTVWFSLFPAFSCLFFVKSRNTREYRPKTGVFCALSCQVGWRTCFLGGLAVWWGGGLKIINAVFCYFYSLLITHLFWMPECFL